MALIDISKFKNRTQVVNHVYQDESYFKPDITFADFLEKAIEGFAGNVNETYARFSRILLEDFKKREDSLLFGIMTRAVGEGNEIEAIKNLIPYLNVENILMMGKSEEEAKEKVSATVELVSFKNSSEIFGALLEYFNTYIKGKVALTEGDEYFLENLQMTSVNSYLYEEPIPVSAADDNTIMTYRYLDFDGENIFYNGNKIGGGEMYKRKKNGRITKNEMLKLAVGEKTYEEFRGRWMHPKVENMIDYLGYVLSDLDESGDTVFELFNKAVAPDGRIGKYWDDQAVVKGNLSDEYLEKKKNEIRKIAYSTLSSDVNSYSPFYFTSKIDSGITTFTNDEFVFASYSDIAQQRDGNRSKLITLGSLLFAIRKNEDDDDGFDLWIKALENVSNGIYKTIIKGAMSNVAYELSKFKTTPPVKFFRDIYMFSRGNLSRVGKLDECDGFVTMTMMTSDSPMSFSAVREIRAKHLLSERNLSFHFTIQ